VRTELVVVAGLAACGLLSCQQLGEAGECGEIPSGGCPTTGGGTCQDRECVALYRCVESGWEHVETCDRPDGSEEAAAQEGEAGSDGMVCGDAPIVLDRDASGSCGDELLYTDCPVSLAVSCPGSACWTGCEDFFACREGVWELTAYCEDGVLKWVGAP